MLPSNLYSSLGGPLQWFVEPWTLYQIRWRLLQKRKSSIITRTENQNPQKEVLSTREVCWKLSTGAKKASIVKQQNAIKGLLQKLCTIASMREIEQHLDRSFHWFLETVSRIKESDTPKEELWTNCQRMLNKKMLQFSPPKGRSHKLTENIRNQQDYVQDVHTVHITLLLHQHSQKDQTQAAPKRKQQSLGLKQNGRLCSKPKKRRLI